MRRGRLHGCRCRLRCLREASLLLARLPASSLAGPESGAACGRTALSQLSLPSIAALSFPRGYASGCAALEDARGDNGEEAEEAESGDDLEAYEDLMLNAETEEGDVSTEGAANADVCDSASLVEEVLALLPRDSRPMRLTELTPSLDVEAISEAYGSVLLMLQRFPRHFHCSLEERQGGEGGPPRWHVRRRQPMTTGDSLPSQGASLPLKHEDRAVTADDMRELCLADELRSLCFHPPAAVARPLKGRASGEARAIRTLASAAEDGRTLPPLDWAALAAALPASSGNVRLVEVRRSFAPEHVRAAIADRGSGLLRLFGEQYSEASPHIDVSLDGVYMARKGMLRQGVPVWTPAAAAAARQTVSGDAVWTGELDEGDEGDDVGDASDRSKDEEAEEAAADAEVETDAPEVFYDGLPGLPSIQFFRPRRPGEQSRRQQATRAGPPPQKKSEPKPKPPAEAPPPAKAKAKADATPPPPAAAKKPKPAKPRTPEELMAAHTEVAEQRGWRTPAEMLDLLVECVPTFFVPVSALIASDSLSKVLGLRSTMRQVVRVYSYYVERNSAADLVRLRPGLVHPHLGKANAHYTAYDASSGSAAAAAEEDGLRGDDAAAVERPSRPPTKAATGAFPILRPIIKSDIDVGPGGMHRRRGPAPPAACASASVSPPPASAAPPQASADTPFRVLPTDVERGPSPLPPSALLFFCLLSSLSCEEWTPLASVVDAATRAIPSLAPAEAVEAALRCVVAHEAGDGPAGAAAAGQSAPSPDSLRDFVRWARLYQLLLLRRTGDDALSVRLRPLWLAPGATGESGAEALPEECGKLFRPLWRPLSLLLSETDKGGRLSPAARSDLLTRARVPSASDGTDADATTAVVDYLRACGRYAWVDRTAGSCRFRRYTGIAEMDDLSHVLIPCLARFASAVTFESTSVVAARAQHGMRAAVGYPEAPNTTGLFATPQITEDASLVLSRIQRHPKDLETRLVDGQLLIRRTTRFAAFGAK